MSGAFQVTSEWQDLPEGAILPGGCQIETNMSTGRKRARLMPELLEPDPDEAQRFLEWLDEGAASFTFQTATDDLEKKKSYPLDPKTGKPKDPLVRIIHLPPDNLKALVALNRKGAAIWVMINEGDGKGRAAENVTRVRAVYTDLDGAPLEPVLQCALAPHMIIESSPGRWHVYWLVDGLPLEQFSAVQQSIIRRFGGDPSINDLCRVMRLPGFLHLKATPFRVRIHDELARPPYSAAEILREFPPVAVNGDGAQHEHRQGESTAELIRQIVTAEHYYPALLPLSYRWVHDGMDAGSVVEALRGLMHGSTGPRDARWDDRFNKIPDLVSSAQDKLEAERPPVTINLAGQPNAEPPPEPQPPLQLLSAAEFVAGYVAPEYVIDGLVQRNRVYSLTAPTGHGKTAVALTLAFHPALGRPLAGRDAEQGRVVYLAAENPDDTRARVILCAAKMGFNLAGTPVEFCPETFNFNNHFNDLTRAVGKDETSLIMVDTGAAFLLAAAQGDDENSNAVMYGFARDLRRLTELPGRPAVLALMHPIKHARCAEDLLPRGGGAFLNEVDGNLTLWAEADRSFTELSWTGKLRGAPFDPITFALEKTTVPGLLDAKGRPTVSVWAYPADHDLVECRARDRRFDDDRMLITMADHPDCSIAALAEKLGWRSSNGQPAKSRVHRVVSRLAEAKLAQKVREQWALTKAGKMAAEHARRHSAAGVTIDLMSPE